MPIIELYNLKLAECNDYINKIYNNKSKTIWLIISGIGNKKAINAVNFLFEISNCNHNSLWINIGIAGHKRFKPGKLYEIKKVTYIKNNKVFCIIDGKTYRYLGFKEDNQPPAVGYLKELFKGELFSFYERKFKVYMQATVARTSLERSFPARFVEKIQYYYSINNGEINQIKLSKKNILNKLKPHSSSIKLFMEKNNSKLKSLKDVVEMFNFIDQLQLNVY